ncbi:MAG TPA: tRNA (adenosine(37)-N6)-dimethylallyltransferase MiaA, partial [Candidatus Paceibacterota bacterium]|nr:tRNA (adenosine(37)-N6)-dimethylallyltransferase MiaA [Candidatus Paceibacterota bacterium]
ALGYRQVVEHLRGETPLAETVERVKARTRQFAKRQVTWFKRQLPFQWLMIESSESPEQIAERLERALIGQSAL